MSLLEYIKICYEMTNNDEVNQSINTHLVTVHICYAHFKKFLSDRLTKLNLVEKEARELVLGSMSAMVKCTSLQEI